MRNFIILFMVALSLGCREEKTIVPDDESRTENIEIGLEDVLEKTIREDRKGVEEAHQKGNSRVVGLRDGTEWLQASEARRLDYIRGTADALSFIDGAGEVAWSTLQEREESQKVMFLGSASTIPHFEARFRSMDGTAQRLANVIAGHAFADIADAVTAHYRNIPLDRNKPVLWVIAVPLFKQLGKSTPNTDKVAISVKPMPRSGQEPSMESR